MCVLFAKEIDTSYIVLAIVACALYIISKKVSHIQKQRNIDCNISRVDYLSGIEFEEYLKHVFEKNGYRVKTTPVTNDYGADLILEKNGIKTVVQAKRYSSKVGIKAVQEVACAKEYYNADNAMVVTNNYFTQQAINLSNAANISLIDRDNLIKIKQGAK